jgi:hypothetical protein
MKSRDWRLTATTHRPFASRPTHLSSGGDIRLTPKTGSRGNGLNDSTKYKVRKSRQANGGLGAKKRLQPGRLGPSDSRP